MSKFKVAASRSPPAQNRGVKERLNDTVVPEKDRAGEG
jgi:hypothetical protein